MSMGQQQMIGTAQGRAFASQGNSLKEPPLLIQLEARLVQLRARQQDVIGRVLGLSVRAFGAMEEIDAERVLDPNSAKQQDAEPSQARKLHMLITNLEQQISEMDQALIRAERLV